MEVSELTLRLIILLIPGAIASLIVEIATVHKPWSSFKFMLNAILLGFFSYLTAQLFSSFQHLFVTGEAELRVWSVLVGSTSLPFGEIVFASILSVGIGFVATAIIQKKYIIRFARHIHASTKFGDENAFSYFLNSPEIVDVYVRDKDKNLTYHGVVRSFSETNSISEIVLGDVAVYSSDDSTLLYTLDGIYLSMPKDKVTIELPKAEKP